MHPVAYASRYKSQAHCASIRIAARPSSVAKFSGNAFRHTQTASLHHGTILMDVDFTKLGRYLQPSKAKLDAKGVQSVRARVGNLSELAPDITIPALKTALFDAFQQEYGSTDTLKITLANANGAIEGIDQGLVKQLPALMGKLDATVGKLDSVAGNADALIAENRPALQSFTNDGLTQLGPIRVELRSLVRDLRRITDSLDGGPAGYILGRDAPKEFEPK